MLTNTDNIVKHVELHDKIDNETLLGLAEISLNAVYPSIKGVIANIAVRETNVVLEPLNKALISRGVGSKNWYVGTVAELNRKDAEMNMRRISKHFHDAVDSIKKIVKDLRVPAAEKADAVALLELLSEPQPMTSLSILEDFADEIVSELAA